MRFNYSRRESSLKLAWIPLFLNHIFTLISSRRSSSWTHYNFLSFRESSLVNSKHFKFKGIFEPFSKAFSSTDYAIRDNMKFNCSQRDSSFDIVRILVGTWPNLRISLTSKNPKIFNNTSSRRYSSWTHDNFDALTL